MVYDYYQSALLLWFLICFDENSIQDEQVRLHENRRSAVRQNKAGIAINVWLQALADDLSSSCVFKPFNQLPAWLH